MLQIIIMVLVLLLLIVVTAGYWLFYYVAGRRIREPRRYLPEYLEPYRAEMDEGVNWFQMQEPERVEIPASDGERLVALHLEADDPRGTVILMHGYRTSPYNDFGCVFRFYYEKGYSILAPYQRGHGESGGDFICFGVKERFDCRDWARYISDRYGPEHDIFLDGMSMGSTTVLMAAGLDLPESVRGVISDCGYTSPWEELREVFQQRHVPAHPCLEITDLFARLLAGYGLRDCSTIDAMELGRLPVLFIHGEADAFVPISFTRRNYEACRAEKVLITVPGAQHGASYLVASAQCRQTLADFLQNHSTHY